MATVYRHPDHLTPPDMIFVDGRYDHEATMKAEAKWTADLADWCRSRPQGKGDLVGKVIYIPFADGAAQYMILSHKPVALIHMPLGDAWNVPEYQTRGLRISDLRRMACDPVTV